MEIRINELIDKFNYGQLSDKELELFNSTLETNNKFREEFNHYLKMKEYLLDDSLAMFKEFLTSISYKVVNGNT